MQNTYLFVYGTLMKTSEHNMHRVLAEHSEFVSHAWLLGKLYQIHDYPGVIESSSPDDRVYGELYRLTKADLVLPQLDDFEECSAAFPEPREYIRKRILVNLSPEETEMAWAYIYNHPVSDHKRIMSGIFKEM
ncbi:gamma-glutamylcyclotransferase family protein [Methylophaga sp.]|uniref:gamma-glutamylcyclotransferase family protein n=1 Tax=Methylophaga sp. TaxID=2024840 RepID=UPI003F6A49D0